MGSYQIMLKLSWLKLYYQYKFYCCIYLVTRKRYEYLYVQFTQTFFLYLFTFFSNINCGYKDTFIFDIIYYEAI